MEKRETFSSRLGFVLISAGCAIGLGNVWRFPYITGKYGGAAFVLLYLLFLQNQPLPIEIQGIFHAITGKNQSASLRQRLQKQMHLREIGRASCRERVCLYV